MGTKWETACQVPWVCGALLRCFGCSRAQYCQIDRKMLRFVETSNGTPNAGLRPQEVPPAEFIGW